MGAELHAEAGPGVEVVGESDGSGRALVAADRPELLEGAGTLDGGGVVALVGVDIVGVAIGGDRSLLGSTTAWVESTEVLHDVVLDQGVPLLKTCGQCWSNPVRFNDLLSSRTQPSMSCHSAGMCQCR